jgi:hypothetical protein
LETQSKNNETSQELPILKKGIFYAILDGPSDIVMEDKTKRGLVVQERSLDEKYGVNSDKGTIYDMDGIGHKVGMDLKKYLIMQQRWNKDIRRSEKRPALIIRKHF